MKDILHQKFSDCELEDAFFNGFNLLSIKI